jgi:hypothetical protein
MLKRVCLYKVTSLSEVKDVSSKTPSARTVAYVPLAATVSIPDVSKISPK